LSEKSKSSWEHGVEEEGSLDFAKFRQIRGILSNFSDFAKITFHDYLESLLRTCWEKKLLLRAFWEKVPTLREIKTFGGGGGRVHCEN
jgi:hypothetical protein